MSFFISDALAEGAAAAQQQPDPIMGLLPIFILFAVFYFLLLRPQTKRAKEHQKMVAALGKGDEVLTQGGIYGKIVELGDDYAAVELGENQVVKVQRAAIASLLPKGTLKSLK